MARSESSNYKQVKIHSYEGCPGIAQGDCGMIVIRDIQDLDMSLSNPIYSDLL